MSKLHFSDDSNSQNKLKFSETKGSHVLNTAAGMVSSQIHRKIHESDDDNAGTEAVNTATESAERLYRRKAKRRYAKAKRTERYAKTFRQTGKAASKTVDRAKKTSEFVSKHSKAILIVIALFVVMLILLTIISSCSVMFQGITSAFSSTTYPGNDSDMLNAEAEYCVKEDELRHILEVYEQTHSYDEYSFILCEIGHNPYELVSLVAVLSEGNIDSFSDILNMVYENQYILTESVETEIRYRMEQRGGRWVRIPYTYTICSVTLESGSITETAEDILTPEQFELYKVYLETKGNKPELFQ